MKSHVSGQATTAIVAPQLSAHRRNLIALLGEAKVISTAEYEVAAQNILACQCLATLQRWYRNCIREIARREEAVGMGQPTAPVVYATAEQVSELHTLAQHPAITKAERTRALLTLPTLTQPAAATLLAWLRRMQQTPRYQFTPTLALPVRQYEAAKVDYVQDAATGRVLPLLQTKFGGPLVRRVWAN